MEFKAAESFRPRVLAASPGAYRVVVGETHYIYSAQHRLLGLATNGAVAWRRAWEALSSPQPKRKTK